MIPDSDFAVPQSSYEAPVSLILVDPDVDPLVTVRFNAAYLPFILGSLKQLAQPVTWDTVDPSALELIQKRVALLIGQFAEASEDNEPPFWTDEEDADGLPESPWYDKLADWIIEGFLAISGFPQAAIVYSTSVPKIRMAFKTGNFGALVRVLLNNLEMYTGDTYAPIDGLLGQTLDLEGFAAAHSLGAPPWQLKVIHNGSGPNIPSGHTAYLNVVRKRLTDEMPIQFRQASPCLVEYSEDGGSTWSTVADLSECSTGGAEPGSMKPWPGDTAPSGWLMCDGSAVSRTTYAALFAVTGTRFGAGNGTTTFNLPDLRSRDVVGAGQGSGLSNRPLASTGGEETHQLTEAELATHHHTIASGYGGAGSNYGLTWTGWQYVNNVNTASDGSGTGHNNMQPYLALNWLIKT